MVFRLSGTGSVGATIRMYLEQYQNDKEKLGGSGQDGLADLVKCAVEFSKMKVCGVWWFFGFFFSYLFSFLPGIHWKGGAHCDYLKCSSKTTINKEREMK